LKAKGEGAIKSDGQQIPTGDWLNGSVLAQTINISYLVHRSRFATSALLVSEIFRLYFVLTSATERLVHERLRQLHYENPVVRCRDCGRNHKEIFVKEGDAKEILEEVEMVIRNVDGSLQMDYGS
jgi:hypothetical protein